MASCGRVPRSPARFLRYLGAVVARAYVSAGSAHAPPPSSAGARLPITTDAGIGLHPRERCGECIRGAAPSRAQVGAGRGGHHRDCATAAGRARAPVWTSPARYRLTVLARPPEFGPTLVRVLPVHDD